MRVDDLADAFAAAFDQAEADPLIERRREADRGDIALAPGQRRRIVFLQEMRSGADAVGLVEGPDADDSVAVLRHHAFAACHHAPDIVLLGRHHAS